MQKDLSRRLIEATVRRALDRGIHAPDRATRNLVDMGLALTRGPVQRQLLTTVQRMLRKPDSAYYALARDALAHVDHERLLQFGVNLGYESCAKGAQRARGRAGRDPVPWALDLSVDSSIPGGAVRYPALLREAAALGIHTFLLRPQGDPAAVLALPPVVEDGAFVLLLDPPAITETALQALAGAPNVLVAVRAEAAPAGVPAACRRLRRARFPYAVYSTCHRAAPVLAGGWLSALAELHPLFVFLEAAEDCPPAEADALYQYICRLRACQTCPVVPVDLRRDVAFITRSIGGEGAPQPAAFDGSGSLRGAPARAGDPGCNLFCAGLGEILQRARPACRL